MFYIVYKITNTLNGKIYIGVHKTKDLNDGYMGSGKVIKRAIEKYGIENFSKEILFEVENSEEMYEMESTIVNEEFVQRQDTYNLNVGGKGGFDYINEHGLGVGYGDNFSWYLEKLKDPEFARKNSQKTKAHFDNLRRQGKLSGFLNKKHSTKTRESISKNVSGHRNGSFGTMWVYHIENKENMKIPKELLSDYEVLGWIKGRKMKF